MEALKFMETWQKATMVRSVHFFFGDQACAVWRREFCSVRTLGFGGVKRRGEKGGAAVAVVVDVAGVVVGVQRDRGVL
jgi:hypothetical protein